MNIDPKLLDQVRNMLLKSNTTIAVAESVTAGNVQAALSLAKDASLFFQGGITAYNIGQKCRHLYIDPVQAIATDCVSKKTSDQMAIAVCKMFSSDYGLGITGYASLVPEQNIKSLYAFLSVSKNGKLLLSKKITTTLQDPYEVQLFYTNRLLQICVAALSKK